MTERRAAPGAGRGRAARLGVALRATAAVLSVLLGESARADGYTLRLEGDAAATEQKTTDASGVTSSSRGQAFADSYRLSLSKTLYESLRFSGDGSLTDVHNVSDADGTHSSSTSLNWAGGGRLEFGGPVLGGGVSYDQRQQSSASTQLLEGGAPALSTVSPTLASETIGASLTWRPIDLPPLDLRASRSSQYDLARRSRDTTATTATLTTAFTPSGQLDGSLNLGYSELVDRLHGSSTATWSAQGSGRYTGSLLGRGTYYVSDTTSASVRDTRARGPGGTVTTQQFATGGLALLEPVPAPPEQATLRSLPALVDGNVAAPAGVSLGTAASSRGDVARRHLGLQFPDVLRPVNTLYVWVAQPLPATVASLFTWSAYRSDDNVTWTAIPLAGPVSFGDFEARFEITIPTTRARYLKVVTSPLPAALTTDPRAADVQVTELQAYDVVSADSVRGWSRAWSTSLNGAATLPLTSDRRLAYDGAFTLSLVGPSAGDSWVVVNGISYGRPLSATTSLAARVQRSDTGGSGGSHSGQTTWGATLSAQPLPTVSGSAGYNGSYGATAGKTTLTNGVTGLLTLAVYEGVAATAAAGTSVAVAGEQVARSTQGTVSIGVAPASYLSLTGSYGLVQSTTSGAGPDATGGPPVAARSGVSEVLAGTVNYAPVPALSLGANATRLRQTGEPAHVFAGFQVSYSPFRGGNLLLGVNHAESFDELSHASSRTSGASVGWRPTTWANLTAAYTLGGTRTDLGRTDAQSLAARLTITL